MDNTQVLFTELELAGVELAEGDALVDGKAFDGIAAGKFIDMYGRETEIKEADLELMAQNTRDAIEMTRTAEGELVGLPIDAKGHENGDGAGWIVDAQVEEGKIRFSPRWTEVGYTLIKKGIRRFFSATIDLGNKVALGGTLTNWPATRNSKRQILLRPIALSEGSYGFVELEDEKSDSLNSKVYAVSRSFYSQTGWGYYVTDVFDAYVVVHDGTNMYQVNFTETDGEFAFEARDEWRKVKLIYVEFQHFMNELKELSSRLMPVMDEPVEIPTEEEAQQEVLEMEVTIEQLTEMINTAVSNAVAEVPQPAELEGAPEVPAEVLAGIHAQYKQQADEKAALAVQNYQREMEVDTRVSALVGGTERALQADADKLRTQLLALSKDGQEFWLGLLESVMADGVADFSEAGHSATMKGVIEFPKEFKPSLDKWLAEGHDLSSYFAANALELGDQGDYDLTAYEEKE